MKSMNRKVWTLFALLIAIILLLFSPTLVTIIFFPANSSLSLAFSFFFSGLLLLLLGIKQQSVLKRNGPTSPPWWKTIPIVLSLQMLSSGIMMFSLSKLIRERVSDVVLIVVAVPALILTSGLSIYVVVLATRQIAANRKTNNKS